MIEDTLKSVLYLELSSEGEHERGANSVEQANERVVRANKRADERVAQY